MRISDETIRGLGIVTVTVLIVVCALGLWIVIWALSLIFSYGLFGL